MTHNYMMWLHVTKSDTLKMFLSQSKFNLPHMVTLNIKLIVLSFNKYSY